MSTGPGGGGGTGPGGGGGTGPGRYGIFAPTLLAEADREVTLADVIELLDLTVHLLEDFTAENAEEAIRADLVRVGLLRHLRTVRRLADSRSPVRQNLVFAAAVADGPDRLPSAQGEEPMPGSADASSASGSSPGRMVAAGALRGDRAGGPPVPGADAGFRLPRDIRGER